MNTRKVVRKKSINAKKNNRRKIAKRKKYTSKNDNMNRSEKLLNGVALWVSYYLTRPDIFCDEYLGISLKPFQKILIYCMMNYNYTAFFASRGLGRLYPMVSL